MTGCGTTTYTDPDDYRVNVPGASLDLVLTSGEAFKARVTWVKLRRLTLVLADEATPHISFLSLDQARIFIAFPLRGEAVWNGVRLVRGDFVVHGPGERLHHLAQGAARWGVISIRAEDLAAYGRTLLGKDLALPHADHFLRPRTKATAEVLRLHAQACRLASTRQDLMAHREVARSLEQQLIVALVNMLSCTAGRLHPGAGLRRANIMAHFQEALASQPRQPRLSDLCALIGVPQRTLRICCKQFLGRSPLDYARLRRLNLARSALSMSDHESVSVAGIARSHGFTEPGRFAGAYRALFGESPSATLHRNTAESA